MISTLTGRTINPFNLGSEDIHIVDIAHSLACTNRFAGMAKRPISVAQHSVYVARLVENTPHALQGLLHDASEAYLGDIPKLLKETRTFNAYRKLEDYVQCKIFNRFNCNLNLAKEVEEADKLMVRFEGYSSYGKKFDFCGHGDEYPPLTEDERKRVGPWTPWYWKDAKEVFLAEFLRFTGTEDEWNLRNDY